MKKKRLFISFVLLIICGLAGYVRYTAAAEKPLIKRTEGIAYIAFYTKTENQGEKSVGTANEEEIRALLNSWSNIRIKGNLRKKMLKDYICITTYDIEGNSVEVFYADENAIWKNKIPCKIIKGENPYGQIKDIVDVLRG